ncbi:MAG: DUF4276 family protein [Nannocystis sp.]|nr:DUF4276 family protein [Nannocystis sp.]
MVDLHIIVEGQTEQTFVRELLAPHLGHHGVFAVPRLVGKPGHKGGNSFPAARTDILATLKQRAEIYCTTMFDYYGLRSDWPGYEEARAQPSAAAVSLLAEHLHAEIARRLPSAADRFIPYFQRHEFEALLFAEPNSLAQNIEVDPKRVTELLSRYGGEPEAINTDKGPSRHIQELAPSFKKRIDGPLLALDIGLAAIRGRCPHFDTWLTRLEALARPT